jgi:hypothetical protein
VCKGSESLKSTDLGFQPEIPTVQLSASLTLLEFFGAKESDPLIRDLSLGLVKDILIS